MPVWISLIILLGISGLLYLQLRTLRREVTMGVPHLFFWPHPAYRNRPANSHSLYLKFSIAFNALSAAGLVVMWLVAVAFLLESLGVIY